MSTFAIVGYRYRWPAKAILDVLATGTTLGLTAEPTNVADPNAIKVTVLRGNIASVARGVLSHEYGIKTEALPLEIHLGYIPAELAALLRADGFTHATGTFSVGARGGPQVILKE